MFQNANLYNSKVKLKIFSHFCYTFDFFDVLSLSHLFIFLCFLSVQVDVFHFFGFIFFCRLPPSTASFSPLPTRSGTAGTPQLVFGPKQVHLPQEAFIIGSIHKMIRPAVFSVIHVQFRQNSCPQLLFFSVSLFLMLLLFRSYALPGTCLDIGFRLVSQSGRPRIVQLVENHP